MRHSTLWTARKIAGILPKLEPLVYRKKEMLEPFRYLALSSPAEPPPVGAEVDDSAWSVVAPNTYWGSWRTNFIMRGEFTAPADWPADSVVALDLQLGTSGEFSHPEALVYIDGEPYGTADRHHHEIIVPQRWRDGQPHRLALHGWTGNMDWTPSGTQLLMGTNSIVQINQPLRDFLAVARVALGAVNSISDNDPARGLLLNALESAWEILDVREPFGDRFYSSVPAALATLRKGIEQAGGPLDVELIATGHAHIDVAWLWPLGQTRRKAGRTFHTVLRMMEQFPDYHFTQSQPQLYEYVRQDYPELFAEIKKLVDAGRWEPIGDMWVEADCNISGPESLARQFLLGRSFFKSHFAGETSGVLWLPDVFGYAWALPQLIKEAGLNYFFTIKIGWSQYNRLPYDSFWWQGLDGTRVLTHFSPTPEQPGGTIGSYNAPATAEAVLGSWTNFRQKDLVGKVGDQIPPLLMAFGYGDGGGGPTREMLENLREMRSFPALPRVTQKSVSEFFSDLEQTAGDRLPTWNGELYLELHRGTYTTQSRNKRANRKSEFMLHDAEFLATLATLLDSDYRYPSDDFTRAWRLLALNQFHDIIPGSSIGAVYVESQQQYAEIAQLAMSAQASALAVISPHYSSDILVVNPTSFARSDLAFYTGDLATAEALVAPDGRAITVQRTEGGAWLDLGTLAPFSVTPSRSEKARQAAVQSDLIVEPNLLENSFLRVELNAAGDITRIYDKQAGREVLPAGAIAAQFQAYEDRPMDWDAWDVDIYFESKMWLADPATGVRVSEAGPLLGSIEVRRRILNSEYVQTISLAHNSPRLDFSVKIDWRERHILLKTAFPVDVLATHATYEIQWGNVQRPTHRNTSWDWARFETAAQKWADLSEGDYGVSVLNDCKYGYDTHDNVIRLSLLRSPTYPDSEADQGEHTFAFSLLPHRGGWDELTIAAAYALNDPLLVVARTTGAPSAATIVAPADALLEVDQPNIVIETVKRAEDGAGIIVRMYESQRKRGQMRLRTGFKLAAAWRCNLLEENQRELAVEPDGLLLEVRPYEIITLRLAPTR